MKLGSGSFNGLNFGAGTAFVIRGITGWDTSPPIRKTDEPRAGGHGRWQGISLYDSRIIGMTLTIKASGADDLWTKLAQVKTAFQLTDDEKPFYLNDSAWFANVKVNNRDPKYDASIPLDALSTMDVELELEATDPRLYSATETVKAASATSSGGGRSYPKQYPVSYGEAATTDSVTVSNGGDFETYPVITFAGPLASPGVEDTTNGNRIDFPTLSMEAGDSLVLDPRNQAVLLNGFSRPDLLGPNATLLSSFVLTPGSHQLDFIFRTTTLGGSMTVRFRSARI